MSDATKEREEYVFIPSRITCPMCGGGKKTQVKLLKTQLRLLQSIAIKKKKK